MSQSEEQKKASITKGLAVVGLLTAVLLLVWLAVQIASLIPGAFGSLASLADSVYNYDHEVALNVGTERKVVNSGDVFTINWDEVDQDGSFSFRYNCVDGVSITVRPSNGQVIDLLCDTVFPVTSGAGLELIMRTERNRFADVNYTISFIPTLDASQSVAENGVVTIVNPSIPAGETIMVEDETEPETLEESTSDTQMVEATEEPEPEPTVTENTTETSTPTPTTGTSPQYVETVTYSIPVSDPNGYTDIKVNYRGVGIVSNNRFISRRELKDNQAGALSFTIDNIGTKTSQDWEFTAVLPDGTTYESGTEEPLKPGEIASYIIQFDGVDDTGVKPFSVDVTTGSDRNRNNNSFTWSVRIVD